MCVVHGEDIKIFFDELGDFGRLPLTHVQDNNYALNLWCECITLNMFDQFVSMICVTH